MEETASQPSSEGSKKDDHMTAWLTLIIGGVILIIGLLGQIFGIRGGKSGHPADKRVGTIVVSIGSVVVGVWIASLAAIRLLHMHSH
jgi:uncharacterized membrane protein YiaA